MSGSPGGRGAEDVELLDDGSSAAGGLAEPAENPISGLMNCASHVVEHRVRGEYVKTFRLLGSELPTLGLLIMIMLIMTASQCKWARRRNIISLSNRHIPHSLTKNDPDTATQYMGPKRANFMPFRPPSYSTIVLESSV